MGSTPNEMGLTPGGRDADSQELETSQLSSVSVAAVVRTVNFWLLLPGATLAISAINAVFQHCILYLRNIGYSATTASDVLSTLLAISLVGRILVGYIADRFQKKNTMALFYLLLGASIPLLLIARQPVAAWSFTVAFAFVLGADYMLIPLITAECFGTDALGKLLALIIMFYTAGQWVASWVSGKIFDSCHNYDLASKIMTDAAVLGASAIYAISVPAGGIASPVWST